MTQLHRQNSYPDISGDRLTLGDKLAISRTTLANERTMLAYFRTALAIMVTGVSLIKFFDSLVLGILGWMLIPLGAITIFIGIQRFRQISASIHTSALQKREKPPHAV